MVYMSSFIDKINSLIGAPYDEREFHCWNLVEILVPNAPKISVVSQSLYLNAKTFKNEIQNHRLKEVQKFADKDIILLGNKETFFHSGVYFNGGVVHAKEGGVVYEKMDKIKLFYANIKGLRV